MDSKCLVFLLMFINILASENNEGSNPKKYHPFFFIFRSKNLKNSDSLKKEFSLVIEKVFDNYLNQSLSIPDEKEPGINNKKRKATDPLPTTILKLKKRKRNESVNTTLNL